MCALIKYDLSALVPSAEDLKPLAPYLLGEVPRDNGEWDLHCPLHEDENRSASLNVRNGTWYCNLGCGGGSYKDLLARKDEWLPPPESHGAYSNGNPASHSVGRLPLKEASVAGWVSRLQENPKLLRKFLDRRGLNNGTVKKFEIGHNGNAFTIPIRDQSGVLANIRYYDMMAPRGRRKIWSEAGWGSPPRLFPFSAVESSSSEIVICEGELDCLVLIQNGFNAVTRTAGADTWDRSWNKYFAGKTVYLCNDRDRKGAEANVKISHALKKHAKEIRIIHLPFRMQPKRGKDVTDFFAEHTVEEFRTLMRESEVAHGEKVIDLDPTDATILDTFDSRKVGEPLRMYATVQGKLDPGYSIPSKAWVKCTLDYDPKKCKQCPLNDLNGKKPITISSSNPLVLQMIDATNHQVKKLIHEESGAIPRCPKLEVEIKQHQAVEVLYARPSIDHVRQTGDSSFRARRIYSVGKHDTEANRLVRVTGALYPSPQNQLNEFLAWQVDEVEASIDRFYLRKGLKKSLEVFRPRRRQSPLAKRVEIARNISRTITKIYGRDEMHVLMDLVFHSPLAFYFDGKFVNRGWLEVLFLGDTRTGKSEVASRLCEHYQAGEIISCETSSLAGVLGGVQQYGGSNQWSLSWGALPLNDRRLVVLEEVGGLSHDEIAQLSSLRSSGEAQLTKIVSGRTSARTRQIWLANPPGKGGMDGYTYGIDAIPPLIGAPEDIARFDLVMSLKKGEVPANVINQASREEVTLKYKTEECAALVMYCWHLKPEQWQMTALAEERVFELANEIGSRYIEDPPLIQVADVRIKIARIAHSLAGSTFNINESGDAVITDVAHVEDAVRLMDHIYGMANFGYKARSEEWISDTEYARMHKDEVKKYLEENDRLIRFLRSQPTFKRQDLEEILNTTRERANGIISRLYESRMIKKQGGFVVSTPVLHEILREL